MTTSPKAELPHPLPEARLSTPASLSEVDTERTGPLSTPPAGESRSFPGDTGELAIETRRVLVQLLLGPSLDGRRHTRLWPILLRDEAIVRRRLHDLFLDLVVDRDHQVAFTRQVDADDLEVPVLLRRSPLTFLDSVLLLFLRQRLTQAEAQGERAVVSIDEMSEHMSVFERQSNTDKVLFAKRMRNAIEKMKGDNVLQKIRSTEDRFEVSPTLRLLFSAEDIQALTRVYASLALGSEKMDGGVETGNPSIAELAETAIVGSTNEEPIDEESA
jgi:Domain of unknown function (DUF4194)